ncbi:MAG: cyclic nucleotide-binding domain-containing protein [Lacunisphaera sp.]
MEINLILTAKSWQLASQLEHTKPFGGVLMVKNVPERTYLAVTPRQWQVLTRFGEPRTVPQVLETVISDRICPELREFYELILKAVKARIIVQPGQSVIAVPAIDWMVAVKPSRLRFVLWSLFVVGLGCTVTLRPALPATLLDYAASIGIMLVAGIVGAALSASLLRGAGGEVYRNRRWLVGISDSRMLTPADQRLVALAPLALLAATTGFLTWHHPMWSLFPLGALLLLLRPIFRGRVTQMIRASATKRLSDAESRFMFPPNRTPGSRWKLLRDSLRNPSTWVEITYGIIWTLALGYFFGVLTEVPPWRLEFWQAQGPRIGVAVFGSLAVLGAGYLISEFYLFATDRALVHRNNLRLWYRRIFGRSGIVVDESARLRAVLRSPLLRMLPPPAQRSIAKVLRPQRFGAWKILHKSDEPVSHVSLILSGKVGVYRKLGSGRWVLVQVLCEDDIVGLHSVADREFPEFKYRTLTPVLLLRMDRAVADELVVSQIPAIAITSQVQKLPFLCRIKLCENWHIQAIQRCAELSRIVNYKDNDVILQSGFYSDSFFIMFEGEAKISNRGKVRGVIHGGDFFGEIGLLQNSNTTAQVTAGPGTRCLCIPRREFLRFVAHNYTVALELERVSSKRLGYPIFPLTQGNFQTI